MIAQIRGTVIDVRLNLITVDVSGIGYQVIVTPELAAATNIGQTISLFTSLVVREDSWSLFGFETLDGKSLFEELQSVTGIGPKVANALLAVYQPGDLRAVISTQDNAALERVPGIGKKVASRILLELKDKYSSATRSKTSLSGPWRTQIIGALTGLGYSNKEAELAVENALQHLGRAPSEDDLPEILKLALAQSGKNK
ncbi:MAG: Holliday junction branch migration protein RuvA [Candidatus Nanopelagicaceae bacterium]|nr:Holliday junction branch migration protein RuvA [Candidatus Nanopelagicaceae bacterium]